MRLLLFSVLIATIATASGHGGAMGIVKERMDVMEDVASANKALRAMARGKVAVDADAVRTHARTISAHARRIPALFPDTEASREGHATEALPEVWEQWETFGRISRQLALRAAHLADLPEIDTETLSENLKKIGDTCRGCHRDFRRKKR